MASKKDKETKRKPGRPKKVKQEELQLEEVSVNKPMSKATKIVLLIIFIALFICALSKSGSFGIVANNLLSYIFGKYYFIVLFTLLFFLVKVMFYEDNKKFPINVYVGIIILNIAVMMLSSIVLEKGNTINFDIIKELTNDLFSNIGSPSTNFKGGLIGTIIYAFAESLFGSTGSVVTLVLLFVISAILIIPLTLFKKAAIASKTAIENTAASLEETIAQKEEQKRLELEKQKELESQRELEEIQCLNESEQSGLLDKVEEAIDENVIENKDGPDVEYVENKSEFSRNFFLNADGSRNIIPTNDSSDFEEISETYSNDNLESDDNNNQVKAETPSASRNIQTKLEDAAEPKLQNNHQHLKKQSTFKHYHLPNSQELLSKVSNTTSNKNETSAEYRGKELIKILSNFGIKATLSEYHIGPSVTKFEIKPDATVNLAKINALSDNIKMGLSAKSIRIEAPIPGKNAVGVEVPNAENTPVRMAELINSVPSNKRLNKLLFALGKDLSGTPIFCDLAKMPHLLIAGATGSGKSVCINTIITSYLLRTKPDEVKMILVDPKKVEFTPYHDIPHLLWPVITDAKTASLMLKKMVAIMEERYDAFSKAAVRDINSYNEKVLEHNKNLRQGEEPMTKLPYIVVIIDELADLMQTAKNDVESSITRITQLARASGIHLIVATQRPSTDVITGLIKSNIPSRISFAVSSAIDSRTILDSAGAEELLGNGDMLYSPQGENVPKRLQGCWVTDEEIDHVTSFVKSQAKPDYDDTYFALQNANSSGGSNATSGEEDDLYNDVVEFIAKTKKASTSALQRRFGIGYNRAARLIDTLEENGLIGPSNGSKAREVYVKEKAD